MSILRTPLTLFCLGVACCSPSKTGGQVATTDTPDQSSEHQDTTTSSPSTSGPLPTSGPPICDGNPKEIPNATCIPSDPEDRLACTQSGNTFDARFVAAACCEGLKRSEVWDPEEGAAIDGLPEGCIDNSIPGTRACLPCGNGVCDSKLGKVSENQCNCPEDCSGTPDSL